MPVQWITKLQKAPDRTGAFSHAAGQGPAYEVHLWPNRSLPSGGFVLFIGLTGALFALPLVALLGSPALWGVLPFFLLVLWGMWYAIDRNTRDGQVLERLLLWQDHIHLEHTAPRKPVRTWQANPFWAKLELLPEGGPVPNYLTLSGNGRTVELGAFLSPEERSELYRELAAALQMVRRHP